MSVNKLNIRLILSFIVYILINSLFIYKYGLRQDYIPVSLLLILFPVFIFILFFLIQKITLKVYYLKLIYFSIVVIFFFMTIGVNIYVDGYSLNVDRWSAMEISIRAILNGVYPYSIMDHLNQLSSNLPSLIFIGIPFYLLGDVGYLQSFSFLFFSYVLCKTINDFKAKIIGILLLIFSSFYLWELYAKSDLMSNFILVLGFCVLWYKKYPKNEFGNPVLLGVSASLLFLTRIPAMIPLSIFFFKGFVKTSSVKKSYFIISAFVSTAIAIYIVIHDYPSLDVLRNYNPLLLQSNKLPFFYSLITVLLPFYFSFKGKSLIELTGYSTLFIGLPTFIAFVLALNNYGFNDIIVNFSFDLSYFNIMSPFLIYYFVLLIEKQGAIFILNH